MIPAVANHLWQSTLFAAAAFLLTLALRRNHARVRHAIWLAASVKFLVPFALLITAGSSVEWPTGAVAAPPEVSAVVEQVSEPFTFVETAGRHRVPAPPWVGVWLAGVVVFLAHWWTRWRRARAVLGAARPVRAEGGIAVVSSGAGIEPGVFGIFRPVLVLPEGIAERLTADQLRAIIAHELCHVRHRDNLAAAVHMGVQALFWFHPLVWWIGVRLMDERERACDEEVLQLGNEPVVYAESILQACKHYLESPLACVSGVTGADLKRRIEEIMRAHTTNKLDFRRKLLVSAAGVIAVALPLAIGLIHAQPQPAFEAASIKPTQPGTPDQFRLMPGGGVNARGFSLKGLIEIAFDVKDFQVSGGPGWLDADGFDIVAKATGNPSREQTRLMLRTLLADRFRMTFHRDTKELPVYLLTVAKNGPKLQKAPGESRKGDGGFGWGPGRINGQGVSLQQFTEIVSMQLHRIVIDKTGVAGTFDLSLLYTPEGYKPREGGNPNEQRPDPDGPSIFTAIQEQLGLRLEAGKGPVEVLVIDHAEKPSEN